MSGRGYVAIDRDTFEHPIFKPEPYTEAQAWIWMIAQAAWAETRVRVGRHIVTLQRGQFAFSERFLAEKWMWSKSRVHRFMVRLRNENMIFFLSKTGPEAVHEVNQITICNYDKYQGVRTADESKSGPQADQKRTKEEPLNHITNKSLSGAVADATGTQAGNGFEEFWREYPKRDGANPKAPSEKRFKAAVRSGADPIAVIAGARRYREALKSEGKLGTPYVAQAMTWLSQRRWEDYSGDTATGPPLVGVQITPGTPQWEAWRAQYEAEGKSFLVRQMDEAREWKKPVFVAQEWPPSEAAA